MAKAAKPRMSLADVMALLEAAGSEQTRKTYRRHGAEDPMFGVSFATLKTLVKRIGVDHSLAVELWGTRNFDARTLATKIADPAAMSPADLDRWASETRARLCGGYLAMLAAEGPHGGVKVTEWTASADANVRATGWTLLGHLAMIDTTTPDVWFLAHIATITAKIHGQPSAERETMNMAIIQMGSRNAALRVAATAAAARIGAVDIDHGDTACKTPDAATYIDKTWTHSAGKGFESPAAHERSREPMRTRC